MAALLGLGMIQGMTLIILSQEKTLLDLVDSDSTSSRIALCEICWDPPGLHGVSNKANRINKTDDSTTDSNFRKLKDLKSILQIDSEHFRKNF